MLRREILILLAFCLFNWVHLLVEGEIEFTACLFIALLKSFFGFELPVISDHNFNLLLDCIDLSLSKYFWAYSLVVLFV